MRVARHCVRHKEEEASQLVLWQPQHGKTKRGKPNTTYIHTLHEDTEFDATGELRTATLDQRHWRGKIHVVRVGARPN